MPEEVKNARLAPWSIPYSSIMGARVLFREHPLPGRGQSSGHALHSALRGVNESYRKTVIKEASMKKLCPPSALTFLLLSLGITPSRSMRAIRVPVSESVTGAAAARRRLANQRRR